MRRDPITPPIVIPAKAGIQLAALEYSWIPAFAGMTVQRHDVISGMRSP
jgi:hypothetical protein